MRLARILLVSSLAVGMLAAAPTLAGAVAPAPPYDVMTFAGVHGSSLVGASHLTLDDSNSTMSMFSPAGGSAGFTLRSDQGFVSDAGYAPGSPITLGVARTFPGPSLDSFSLSYHNGGCNQATGQITFSQYDTQPGTNLVSALAASYSFKCTVDAQPVVGQLRWHSTVPYVAVSVASTDLGTGSIGTPSAPHDVVIKSSGSASLNIGTPTIEGAGADNFAITADSCVGATLAYGQQCIVSVRSTGTGNGPTGGKITAALDVPDNTLSNPDQVELTVTMPIDPTGTYYPINPTRILDTRTALGGHHAKIPAHGVATLPIAGATSQLPAAGIAAVVLNVTVVSPSAYSFLTVYPDDSATPPTASNLNFPAGWIGANSVTVKLGTDGGVNIYNEAGAVDVVIDAVGFYATSAYDTTTRGIGGVYEPIDPVRLVDTRTAEDGATPLQPEETFLGLADLGNDYPNISALVVNVTAVDPSAVGFLSTWNGEGDVDANFPSTLDFFPHTVVPNLAVVPATYCNQDPSCTGTVQFAVKNQSSGTVDVVVDLLGYFDRTVGVEGLLFHPIAPQRIADSRIPQGLPGPVGEAATATITPPASIGDDTTAALALNLTAIAPTAPTFLTVWPGGDGTSEPTASNVNPLPGQVIPNAVITGLSENGSFNVSNAHGNTNVAIDVVGFFDVVYPPPN